MIEVADDQICCYIWALLAQSGSSKHPSWRRNALPVHSNIQIAPPRILLLTLFDLTFTTLSYPRYSIFDYRTISTVAPKKNHRRLLSFLPFFVLLLLPLNSAFAPSNL
jgi:hypothetical protein